MPKSVKIVLGVLLGFVVWFGAATVGDLLAAVKVLAAVLMLFFIPVHYALTTQLAH